MTMNMKGWALLLLLLMPVLAMAEGPVLETSLPEDALLVEKDGTKQLVWQLREGEEWCCYIVAKNISIEALLRFAQHIVIS